MNKRDSPTGAARLREAAITLPCTISLPGCNFSTMPLRAISGDSFRLRDSLACGTVAMQVNFKHHGPKMPVQPEPYRHHLPVRFDDLKSSVLDIKRHVCELRTTGMTGQSWALEHYAPRKVAVRLLEHL